MSFLIRIIGSARIILLPIVGAGNSFETTSSNAIDQKVWGWVGFNVGLEVRSGYCQRSESHP